MSTVRTLLLAALTLAACSQENPYASKKKTGDQAKGPPPKIIGVEPDKFDCESIVTKADVSTIAGGEVVFAPSEIVPAMGTPRPCTWVLEHQMTDKERKEFEKLEEKLAKKAERNQATIDDAMMAWGKSKDKVYGVSYDCRDGAHARTESWYASLPGTMMPSDAGPGYRDITGVGKKAMEAANVQLVFLDDNTQCAVTVSGPDEASRMAIAKIVDQKLVPENAPMRPRSVPQ